MQKRELIAESFICVENDAEHALSFRLSYYIEPEDTSEYILTIEKKAGGFSESAKCYLHDTRRRVQRLMRLLAKHTVTPTTLQYIISDCYNGSECG